MERRNFLKIGAGGLAAACCAGGALGCAVAQERELDAEAMSLTAGKLFMEGGKPCCEAVLAAYCEEAKKKKSPLLPDIALGFAGGFGGQGKTCGVLTGGALAISLAMIEKESDYAKRKPLVGQAVRDFYQRFEQEFGSDQCRTLTGLDLLTEEGEQGMKDGVKAEKCQIYVKTGAKLLAEIIAKA